MSLPHFPNNRFRADESLPGSATTTDSSSTTPTTTESEFLLSTTTTARSNPAAASLIQEETTARTLGGVRSNNNNNMCCPCEEFRTTTTQEDIEFLLTTAKELQNLGEEEEEEDFAITASPISTTTTATATSGEEDSSSGSTTESQVTSTTEENSSTMLPRGMRNLNLDEEGTDFNVTTTTEETPTTTTTPNSTFPAPANPDLIRAVFGRYFERLKRIYELDIKLLEQIGGIISKVDSNVVPQIEQGLDPFLEGGNVDILRLIGILAKTLPSSHFEASITTKLGNLDFLNIGECRWREISNYRNVQSRALDVRACDCKFPFSGGISQGLPRGDRQ